MKIVLHQHYQRLKKNVFQNIDGFLAIVYPQTCKICSADLPEGLPHICPTCLDKLSFTYFEKYGVHHPASEIFWGRVNLVSVYCLLYFKQGSTTQELMHVIKYKEGKDLAVFMGEMLAEKMKEIQEFTFLDALVPIPLHDKKEFIRGYNQSLKICEGIQAKTDLPIVNLVQRKKHHDSQTKKDRFERWDNVAENFEVNTTIPPGITHIALIDDVLTTGSTVEAVARTIQEALPKLKISVITVAFAQ